jgi:hypothetical protein
MPFTPTPPTPPALPVRYYASYFDVVQYRPSPDPLVVPPVDDWAQRWQWIVMPKAPHGHPDDPHYVFSRHQNNKTHRSVWRNTAYRGLPALFESYENFLHGRGALVPRDPIVVELSETELTEYVVGSRKTPWEVIKRAQRAARKLGYTI